MTGRRTDEQGKVRKGEREERQESRKRSRAEMRLRERERRGFRERSGEMRDEIRRRENWIFKMKKKMKRDGNAEGKEGRLRRIYRNDEEKTEGNTEVILGERMRTRMRRRFREGFRDGIMRYSATIWTEIDGGRNIGLQEVKSRER